MRKCSQVKGRFASLGVLSLGVMMIRLRYALSGATNVCSSMVNSGSGEPFSRIGHGPGSSRA